MPRMICTKGGYQVINDDGSTAMNLSVKKGQPIYMHPYNNKLFPEQQSVFLRGVIAALKPNNT